jgi:hypothetical protein
MPIPRKRPILLGPCEFCGTYMAITDKGHLFTAFGKNYFEIRKEIEEGKRQAKEEAIPVEIPKKKS